MMELKIISNDMFIQTAAILALCANNELSDFDFRRKARQEGTEFLPGTAEILRNKMQFYMDQKRKEFNALRAEEN